jgi:hypothetical protein
MKTPKTIIIGENGELQPKKPMRFLKAVLTDGQLSDAQADKPIDFNYIELIARNYGTFAGQPFDLIFCYDDPNERHNGVLFLGNWNDGVIE